MSKSIVLEIPESEAANFEAALDKLLNELPRVEEGAGPTWQEIDRLRDETRERMAEIKAMLNVEENLGRALAAVSIGRRNRAQRQ